MSTSFGRIRTPGTSHSKKHAIRKVAFAIAGLMLAAPPLALAAGSLAIDENQGDQYGWAVGFQTQSEADQNALRECGYGCSVVMRFSNTCAAYAADQANRSTAYGWAYGFSSSSAAQNGALQQCRSRGGSQSHCIVRAWGCD